MIKFWLSIDENEQRARIENRKKSPLTYWKFSENDENALSYYDRMTILKERVIDGEWNVIDYNDKEAGILSLMRILNDRLEALPKWEPFSFGIVSRETRSEKIGNNAWLSEFFGAGAPVRKLSAKATVYPAPFYVQKR